MVILPRRFRVGVLLVGEVCSVAAAHRAGQEIDHAIPVAFGARMLLARVIPPLFVTATGIVVAVRAEIVASIE
jgi:cytochrome c oxidase assembly factor CtaG